MIIIFNKVTVFLVGYHMNCSTLLFIQRCRNEKQPSSLKAIGQRPLLTGFALFVILGHAQNFCKIIQNTSSPKKSMHGTVFKMCMSLNGRCHALFQDVCHALRPMLVAHSIQNNT